MDTETYQSTMRECTKGMMLILTIVFIYQIAIIILLNNVAIYQEKIFL